MTDETNTTTETEDVIDALVDCGFLPMDAVDDEAEILSGGNIDVLQWFADRGWEAFRLDRAGAGSWATLVRWGDDGIKVVVIDRHGVIEAEASFTYNRRGLAMLVAALEVLA